MFSLQFLIFIELYWIIDKLSRILAVVQYEVNLWQKWSKHHRWTTNVKLIFDFKQ